MVVRTLYVHEFSLRVNGPGQEVFSFTLGESFYDGGTTGK